eukprot:5980003-Amphidinium_carterae.1
MPKHAAQFLGLSWFQSVHKVTDAPAGGVQAASNNGCLLHDAFPGVCAKLARVADGEGIWPCNLAELARCSSSTAEHHNEILFKRQP